MTHTHTHTHTANDEPQLGLYLSNIPDPRQRGAELRHSYDVAAMRDPEAMKREWRAHLDWINKNVIGPPKATPTHSVERLKEMGMIGLYAPVED